MAYQCGEDLVLQRGDCALGTLNSTPAGLASDTRSSYQTDNGEKNSQGLLHHGATELSPQYQIPSFMTLCFP